MDPAIKYARTSDGVNIAYQCTGAGAPLVYVPPGGSLGQVWQYDAVRSWMERLAADRQVIRLDYRGLGLSDRGWKFSPHLTALDILAVAEREGLRRFAMFGMLQTAATAICFAHLHPDMVSHLILWSPYANVRDYVASSATLRAAIAAGEKDWPTLSELIGLQAAGWADAAQARSFAAYLRSGVSPDYYVDIENFDLTRQLGELTMPVLVLHRKDVPFPTLEVARHVALSTPAARFVLLEGSALMPFFGDTDSVLNAIAEFMSEPAEALHPGGLTTRELEILALLAGGQSNAGIAQSLTISTRTVERHIGNVYGKLGLHSRSEATAYAFVTVSCPTKVRQTTLASQARGVSPGPGAGRNPLYAETASLAAGFGLSNVVSPLRAVQRWAFHPKNCPRTRLYTQLRGLSNPASTWLHRIRILKELDDEKAG